MNTYRRPPAWIWVAAAVIMSAALVAGLSLEVGMNTSTVIIGVIGGCLTGPGIVATLARIGRNKDA